MRRNLQPTTTRGMAAAVLLLLGLSLATHAQSLNVSGNVTDPTPNPFQGGTWSKGNITLSPGYTLTQDSGTWVVSGSHISRSLLGGGTFLNQGTVDYTATGNSGLTISGGTTVDNEGTLQQSSVANYTWTLSAAGDQILMRAGSSIATSATGRIRTSGAGSLTSFDGSTVQPVNVDLQGSGALLGHATGQLNLGSLNIAAGTVLTQIAGTLGWQGDFTADGKFSLSGTTSTFRLDDDIALNLGEGFAWHLAAVDLNGYRLTIGPATTLRKTGDNSTYGKLLNPGEVVNNGTIEIATTTWGRISVEDGGTIDNYGTIIATSTPINNAIYLNGTNTKLLMRPNTDILVEPTVGAPLYIGGTGVFTSHDGTAVQPITIDIQAGGLTIASTGGGQLALGSLALAAGTSLTQLAGNTTYGWQGDFTADGAFNLSGTWATFRLDDDITLNLGGGFNWAQNDIDLNGHTLTIGPGTTLKKTGDNSTFGKLLNPGNVINQGTIQIATTTWGRISVEAGGMIDNYGTIRATSTPINNAIYLNGANTKLLMRANTDLVVESTAGAALNIGGTGVFTGDDGTTVQPIAMDLAGGGLTLSNSGGGSLNLVSLDLAAGAVLGQSAQYTTVGWQGDMTGDGRFAYTGTGATFRADADITMSFGEGISWAQNDIDLNGNTVTIAAGTVVTKTGGDARFGHLENGGSLVNNGTIFMNTTTWGRIYVDDGGVLNNAGTISVVSTPIAELLQADGTAVFRNLPAGLVLAAQASGTAKVGGAGTIDNLGTFQVSANALQVTGSNLAQWSGSTLTGGTWIATGSGSLMILKKTGVRGDLTTIGTGATVILENGGSIDAVNIALTTVAGALYVNGMTFTTGGTLALDGGRLGGTGTIAGAVAGGGGTIAPGASIETLTIDGDVTMTAASTTEIEVDGATADKLVVTGNVALNGALDVTVIDGGSPLSGAVVIIQKDSAGPIAGTFAGLPEGAVFQSSGENYRISYVGGDGNDVTLAPACNCQPLLDAFLGAVCEAWAASPPSSLGDGVADARAVAESLLIDLGLSGCDECVDAAMALLL